MSSTTSINNTISSLFSVSGLVAVITGGGTGLGLYAARALDANGAKAVYIVGRREEALKKAAATAKNGNIIPIVGDVTDRKAMQDVADRVRKDHGYLNFLFLNAGVGGPTHKQKLGNSPSIAEFQERILSDDTADFTKALDVNTSSILYSIATFIDLLDAGNQKGNIPSDSQVLVTSSIAGLSRNLTLGFAYSASKAAAIHLVKMLSTYFSQHGFRIRVNTVAPGIYPSEITEGMLKDSDKHVSAHGAFSDAVKFDKTTAPQERSGSEEDFAGVILFLTSKAGAYCNGVVLVTDGGRLSIYPASY